MALTDCYLEHYPLLEDTSSYILCCIFYITVTDHNDTGSRISEEKTHVLNVMRRERVVCPLFVLVEI